MSTEDKKQKKGGWALPLLLALPFLAAAAFAALRFGPALLKWINVVIKAAVVS